MYRQWAGLVIEKDSLKPNPNLSNLVLLTGGHEILQGQTHPEGILSPHHATDAMDALAHPCNC